MKNRYSNKTKAAVINRKENGESVLSISKETKIPRSTIYHWINESVRRVR